MPSLARDGDSPGMLEPTTSGLGKDVSGAIGEGPALPVQKDEAPHQSAVTVDLKRSELREVEGSYTHVPSVAPLLDPVKGSGKRASTLQQEAELIRQLSRKSPGGSFVDTPREGALPRLVVSSWWGIECEWTCPQATVNMLSVPPCCRWKVWKLTRTWMRCQQVMHSSSGSPRCFRKLRRLLRRVTPFPGIWSTTVNRLNRDSLREWLLMRFRRTPSHFSLRIIVEVLRAWFDKLAAARVARVTEHPEGDVARRFV